MPLLLLFGLQSLLASSDFPSLGAADGPGSSCSPRHHGSPQSYTPSMAPHKQGFLASRGSAVGSVADVQLSSTGLVQLGKHSIGHDKDKALLAPLSPAAAATDAAPADAVQHHLELLGGTTAEEEAFLRSLGWTDDHEEGADWGLTDEEIAAFQVATAARAAQQQQQQQQRKSRFHQAMVSSSLKGNAVLGVTGVTGVRPGVDAGGSWQQGRSGLKGCSSGVACTSSVMRSTSRAHFGLLLSVLWPAAVAGDDSGVDWYGSGSSDDDDSGDLEE
eukprot:gene8055-8250_t